MAITKVNSSPAYCKTKIANATKKVSSPVTKCVTIDETQNVAYRNTQWTRKEANKAWYAPADYQRMKQETVALAQYVYKSEQEVQDVEDSYTNVLVYVYNLCMDATSERQCKLPKDAKKLLKRAVRKWANRTGLEKICIAPLGNDKRRRRNEYTDAVLDAQDEAMEGCTTPMERAERIRQATESITRASRFFAHFMASVSKIGEMEDAGEEYTCGEYNTVHM